MASATTTTTTTTTGLPTGTSAHITSTATGATPKGVAKSLFSPVTGRGKLLSSFTTSTPTNRPGNQSYSYNVAPYVPKLPSFSGDEPLQKGDCVFSEWRYEVKCLINDPDFNDRSILLAIRRSVKGTARKIMIPLGETATVSDILDKLDAMFGDVSTKGMLMQELFNAQQRPDESVTSFGCRLETLLQTAIDNGHLSRDSKNDLLRHKFWTSLSSDRLKSQTRHKYDTVLDYNSLLREIRQVEKELTLANTSTCRPKVQSNAVVTDQSLDARFHDLEQNLKKEIAQVETRLHTKYESKLDQVLDRLERLQTGSSPSSQQPSGSFQSGYNYSQPPGSFQNNYRSPRPSGPYQSNYRPYNGHGRGRGVCRGLPRGGGNGANHYPRSQPKE